MAYTYNFAIPMGLTKVGLCALHCDIAGSVHLYALDMSGFCWRGGFDDCSCASQHEEDIEATGSFRVLCMSLVEE